MRMDAHELIRISLIYDNTQPEKINPKFFIFLSIEYQCFIISTIPFFAWYYELLCTLFCIVPNYTLALGCLFDLLPENAEINACWKRGANR